MIDRAPILLFDGTCGFCARSVQFVLRHDRRDRSLRFASLQSSIGERLYEQHPELRGVDSVVWLTPAAGMEQELVLVRSAAVLRVLRYLGGVWWLLARIGALVPRAVRDALYDFVARHRHQIIRGDASCLLPSPDERARFLEWDGPA
jgi:predicted DCC family thiol-disulfide oxidoreductase YuxK